LAYKPNYLKANALSIGLTSLKPFEALSIGLTSLKPDLFEAFEAHDLFEAQRLSTGLTFLKPRVSSDVTPFMVRHD